VNNAPDAVTAKLSDGRLLRNGGFLPVNFSDYEKDKATHLGGFVFLCWTASSSLTDFKLT